MMRALPKSLRLRFAEPTAADAPFIRALVNEPGWLRHIGDRNIHDDEAARAYVANGPAASFARHGFGLWRIDKDGEPIGLCGLIKRDHLSEPDIGYAVLERFAGQGLISEAAGAVRDFAQRELGLSKLLAITTLDNHASVRVLQRLGFVEQPSIKDANTGLQSRLFQWTVPTPHSGDVQR